MSVASEDFKISRMTAVLASIGGAKLDLLAQAPADTKLFVGRGLAAFIPAMGGFMTALVVVGDAFKAPLPIGIAAGLLWAVLVMLLDVTVMSTSMEAGSGDKTWQDWGRKILTFLSRLAIAVLIAATLARMLVLVIYDQDIVKQMTDNAARQQIAYEKTVIGPAHAEAQAAAQKTIDDDNAKLSGFYQALTAITHKAQTDKVAWECELGGTSGVKGLCPPGTGFTGNGPVATARHVVYENDLTNEATAQTQYDQAKATYGPEIKSAQDTLTQIKNEEAAESAASQQRISNDTGLIPRQNALSDLERNSPAVQQQVRLLELVFLAIDTFALLAATFVRTPSYNLVLEGEFAKTKQAVARTLRQAESRTAISQSDLEEAEAKASLKVLEAQHQVLLAQIKAAAANAEATAKGQEQTSRAQAGAAEVAVGLEAIQARGAAAKARAQALENEIKASGEAKVHEIKARGQATVDQIQAEGKKVTDIAAAEAARRVAQLDREIAELNRDIRQFEAVG